MCSPSFYLCPRHVQKMLIILPPLCSSPNRRKGAETTTLLPSANTNSFEIKADLAGSMDKSMNFVDQDLTCSTCGSGFVFSAGEQEFFKDKGFTNAPKRCKECKSLRLKRRPMTETHVKCAECGNNTIVPFVPKRNRPVLCRQCFDNQRKPIGTSLI